VWQLAVHSHVRVGTLLCEERTNTHTRKVVEKRENIFLNSMQEVSYHPSNFSANMLSKSETFLCWSLRSEPCLQTFLCLLFQSAT